VRGQRASLSRTKVDVVLLAVRLDSSGRKIALARGVERRGAVWSDVKLYDRAAVVMQLEAGRRVSTGRESELAGDLELLSPVRVLRGNGAEGVLTIDGRRGRSADPASSTDALDLPRF